MHTRRSFLRIAGTSAAALPFLPTLLRGRPAPVAVDFETLRRGAGIFTARGGTIGWLVRDGAVVVVDSQFPDSAERCWNGIAERTDRGLDLFINTHHHGDHTAGNGVFAAQTDRLVAHANVPDLQRAAADAEEADSLTYPNETYNEAWSETIGDETIRLYHNGAAHTGGDTVVHFEEANVAHMGDLVFNRVYPFIDIDGGASTEGWIDTLETMHALFDDETILIHGHGAPDAGITGGRGDLLQMRDFLAALRGFVVEGVQAGTAVDELAEVSHIPDFEEYARDDWPLPLSRCIRAVYREETANGG
ncbi:MAG: MBL fold metallo-hydrolase [Longimonas sp.]|uniref:MBL fold metallo-hydrolase n=1 Tax=Longimonas sp. TaxID=2039626 RepID=UPI00335C4F01